jgi:hypothetical protein
MKGKKMDSNKVSHRTEGFLLDEDPEDWSWEEVLQFIVAGLFMTLMGVLVFLSFIS